MPIILDGTTGITTPGITNTGTFVFQGPIQVPAGTAASPSVTTAAGGHTGLYFPSSSSVALSTTGTQRFVVDSSGNAGLGVTPTAVNNYAVFDMRGRSSIQGGVINFSGSTGTAFGGIQSDTNVTLVAASGARPVAFYTNGAERAQIDAFGNLGLGVTPSSWGTKYRAIQLGNNDPFIIFGRTDGPSYGGIGANFFFDSTDTTKYINSDFASVYLQYNSQHLWYTAPSGTAGNTVSFTQAMTLTAAGDLGVGTTSPIGKLHINSNSKAPFVAYGFKSGEMRQKQVFNGTSSAARTVPLLTIDNWQSNNSNIFVVIEYMTVSPVSAYGQYGRSYAFNDNGGSSAVGTFTAVESYGSPPAVPTLQWSGLTLQMVTPAAQFAFYTVNVRYIAYDGADVSFVTSYYDPG